MSSNPDFSTFQYTELSHPPLESTNMYTNKRVNQFVTDYTNYKNTELQGSGSDSSLFAYYHFIVSPKAIEATNLGALHSSLFLFDNSTNCLLQPYASETGAPELNTPDAHKLNLMKEYNAYLLDLQERMGPLRPFVSSNVSIDVSNLAQLQVANPMALDQFVDKFYPAPKVVGNRGDYAVEILAYFQFPSSGTYTLTFAIDTADDISMFLVWVGDGALLEYTASNATLTVLRKEVQFSVSNRRNIPMRIQYYCSPKAASSMNMTATRKSEEEVLKLMTVKQTDTNALVAPAWFSAPKNKDGLYLPLYPPLYVAFTIDSYGYAAGKFRCFSNFTWMKTKNEGHLSKFYVTFMRNRRDMFARKYDQDPDGIQEIGQLPPPLAGGDTTYYSVDNPSNTSTSLKLPNSFALYRLSVDGRMDKTYQIQTKPSSSGQYEMTQIDDTLLKFSPVSAYKDFPGYFPLDIKNANALTAEQCKVKCNEAPNCSYYYSYTTNGGNASQCVVDTTGLPPHFSQIRVSDTMDVSSGALSLRTKQLNTTKLPDCPSQQQIVPTISSIDDYTRAFKYNNYDVKSSKIVDVNKLGTCGLSRQQEFVKEAQDILYQAHLYKPDGNMVREGLSPKTAAATTTAEGPGNKNTTAVGDTVDSINSNLFNHERLRHTLTGISNTDRDLKSNIGNYHHLSEMMNANDRYDQNGNILMYLRDDVPPSLAQLNANDSQFLSNQHTILFYTGIITAATLIVLAVTMGSE